MIRNELVLKTLNFTMVLIALLSSCSTQTDETPPIFVPSPGVSPVSIPADLLYSRKRGASPAIEYINLSMLRTDINFSYLIVPDTAKLLNYPLITKYSDNSTKVQAYTWTEPLNSTNQEERIKIVHQLYDKGDKELLEIYIKYEGLPFQMMMAAEESKDTLRRGFTAIYPLEFELSKISEHGTFNRKYEWNESDKGIFFYKFTETTNYGVHPDVEYPFFRKIEASVNPDNSGSILAKMYNNIIYKADWNAAGTSGHYERYWFTYKRCGNERGTEGWKESLIAKGRW